MPAASTKPCSGCGAASSRYNCPGCPAATCSLACSKAHKADAHPASSSTSSSGGPQPDPNASAPAIATPSASTYVPLSKYNENHLYDDLTFLSRVGRQVGHIGKDLTRNAWSRKYLSEMDGATESPGASTNSKGKGKAPSRSDQQRELLRKQAQWLRVPLLMLPDGMQMRRENRTAWMHKAQKMVYTARIKFGGSREGAVLGGKKGDSKDALLHRLEPDVDLERVVLEELERRSFALKRQLYSSLGRAVPEGERGPGTRSDRGDFRILPIILASHGLAPLPPSLSLPLEPATALLDEASFQTTAPIKHLPSNIAICLSCHSDRLRNETSQKFLDWWARQVAKGLDPEAEVGTGRATEAASKAEKGESSMGGGEPKMRTWGVRAVEDGEQPSGVVTAPTLEPALAPPSQASPPPPPSSSLISASLLGKLSAQLKGQSAATPKARSTIAAASPSSSSMAATAISAPRAPKAMLGGGVGGAPSTNPSPPSPSSPPPPPLNAKSTPHILLRLTSSSRPLQATLQSLPPGLAILEYPQIEVWDEGELKKRVEEGRVVLRDLNVGGEGEEGGGEEGAHKDARDEENLKRPRDGMDGQSLEKRARLDSSAGTEEVASRQVGSQLVKPMPTPAPTRKPAPPPPPPKMTSLVGYGSDSEDEEEEERELMAATTAAEAAKASVARSELLSASALARKEGGQDSVEEQEDRSEGDVDVDVDVDMGMGMAAYARALGMAPPAPAPASTPAPQASNDDVREAARTLAEGDEQEQKEGEEEVDWGDDE